MRLLLPLAVACPLAAHAFVVSQAGVGRATASRMTATEEAAKAAWLATLDAPLRDAVVAPISQAPASTPAATASTSPAPVTVGEDAAKAAWLAAQDVETSWVTMAAVLSSACEAGVEEACDALSQENEAKKAWLAKLDAEFGMPTASAASAAAASSASLSEAEAKAKWLATQDELTPWSTKKANAMEACQSGVEEACEELSREAAAKAAWLAKIDAEYGFAVASTPASAAPLNVPVTSMSLSEAEAKAKWLASVDADTSWSTKAAGLMAVLEEACDEGEEAACDVLNDEAAAKAAWLAKMDAQLGAPAPSGFVWGATV